MDILPVQSIVPAPPTRRAGPEGSESTISAVYEVNPRALELRSDDVDFVAPSTSAPPRAFLRRQRSARKEDA